MDETQSATAENNYPLCASDALVNAGLGVRFWVQTPREIVPAFVIRYFGRVYAYRNACAHVSVELDWQPGMFFDFGGMNIVCALHGAWYAPDSGACLGGPCKGAKLQKIPVHEQDGMVYSAWPIMAPPPTVPPPTKI